MTELSADGTAVRSRSARLVQDSSKGPAKEAFYDRLRPERAAGGFARDDGALLFYSRVRMLLGPEALVVNYGAGRDRTHDRPAALRRLTDLRGPARCVVGVDVDASVLGNRALDEAHVIRSGEPAPLPAGCADLVLADWLIEHIENAEAFAADVRRLLKPGGWFCARTPNRWGYVALGARLVPERAHAAVLRRLSPTRARDDVFAKHYKMNTLAALDRLFPQDAFESMSYRFNPTPEYHGCNRVLFRCIEAYQKLVPLPLWTTLHVFVRKRA